MEEDYYMTPQMEKSFDNIDRIMRETQASMVASGEKLKKMVIDMQEAMLTSVAELQNRLQHRSRHTSHHIHRHTSSRSSQKESQMKLRNSYHHPQQRTESSSSSHTSYRSHHHHSPSPHQSRHSASSEELEDRRCRRKTEERFRKNRSLPLTDKQGSSHSSSHHTSHHHSRRSSNPKKSEENFDYSPTHSNSHHRHSDSSERSEEHKLRRGSGERSRKSRPLRVFDTLKSSQSLNHRKTESRTSTHRLQRLETDGLYTRTSLSSINLPKEASRSEKESSDSPVGSQAISEPARGFFQSIKEIEVETNKYVFQKMNDKEEIEEKRQVANKVDLNSLEQKRNVMSGGRLVMDDKEADTAVYNQELTFEMYSSSMFKTIFKTQVEEGLPAPYNLKDHQEYAPVVSSAIVHLSGKGPISCDSPDNLGVDYVTGVLRTTSYINEKTAGSYVEQDIETKELVKVKQGLKIAMFSSGEESAYLLGRQFWKPYLGNNPSCSLVRRNATGIRGILTYLPKPLRFSFSNKVGKDEKGGEVESCIKEFPFSTVLVSEHGKHEGLQKGEEIFFDMECGKVTEQKETALQNYSAVGSSVIINLVLNSLIHQPVKYWEGRGAKKKRKLKIIAVSYRPP
ncbi:unnamed protein product [Cuscuta epithymum]|uniref:Uncharacterized protein n=1 Tax=Cuscuta epithymum TaxID=186058 RepID=A0AAV0FVU4_9ASTE|nr:unnamed protein product [Cuscuta epithymum]